ncbi:beta-lactamase/transpeptidase-like protein [Penicillium riverlandense]|uniref:beta-lactamase/transpeptidase-like protein n=1 Tax=Penicillium riverlandense TaxID=1903569 RepID=UPI0025476C5A|nr:beta-lactamase/transpeptidase-like protein [Penicillium riverlandense]KAJ5815656.1 beta-lactamase/transpeptidase-like protein [Penicillium riverlandense]
MQALEEKIERATMTRKLPATVLAAASRDGSLEYFKPFGKSRLEEDSPPVSSDTTFCLASVTKLVTSVAAMQVVERGLVGLDDDIAKFLPEWKHPQILVGFEGEEDGEKPLLIRAQDRITLRQLLSHTSGIASLDEEKLMKYYAVLGDSRGTVLMRYFKNDDPKVKAKALEEVREMMGSLSVVPLLFEPGTDWVYGQGTDWAGQIVERVTNMTLEQYCLENIFKLLGMTHTTYRLLDNPHVAANLMHLTSRRPDGTVQPSESVYPINPKVDMGGSNLYTSGTDFLKLLSSLLRNDEKLLHPETTDLMFGYRLPNRKTFGHFRTNPEHLEDNFGDLAPVVD